MAPATSPAIPAIKISVCVAAAAATPTIKLAVETMPCRDGQKLAGQGSALAMTGAYALAGELKKAGGDYHIGALLADNQRVKNLLIVWHRSEEYRRHKTQFHFRSPLPRRLRWSARVSPGSSAEA
jgi:hypothetical protein